MYLYKRSTALAGLMTFCFLTNMSSVAQELTPFKKALYRTQQTAKQASGNPIVQGILAGMAEVIPGHYLFHIKNQLQTMQKNKTHAFKKGLLLTDLFDIHMLKKTIKELPISFNPATIYKEGFVPNFLSMILITPLQVAGKKVAADILPLNGELQESISAYCGGAGAALIASPFELGILHQKDGRSFAQTIKKIAVLHGKIRLGRGFPEIMQRDGLFSIGYLWLVQFLNKKINTYLHNEYASGLFAGIISGILITTGTHPFDTIGKKKQFDLSKKTYKSFWQSALKIYSETGWKGFYRGFIPRALRVTFAIPIMGTVYQKLKKFGKNPE